MPWIIQSALVMSNMDFGFHMSYMQILLYHSAVSMGEEYFIGIWKQLD